MYVWGLRHSIHLGHTLGHCIQLLEAGPRMTNTAVSSRCPPISKPSRSPRNLGPLKHALHAPDSLLTHTHCHLHFGAPNPSTEHPRSPPPSARARKHSIPLTFGHVEIRTFEHSSTGELLRVLVQRNYYNQINHYGGFTFPSRSFLSIFFNRRFVFNTMSICNQHDLVSTFACLSE